MLLDLLVLN